AEDMKIGIRQKLIAKVEVFGKLEDGRMQKIKRPIKPHEVAKIAQENNLEKILSVDGEKISLGNVFGTKARAYLRASEYDRHTAILASTGAGKSYTTANLIKEYARLGLPVVVVDTHGEYPKLLEKLSEKNSFTLKLYTIKHERKGYEKLLIPLCDLEAQDFHHFIGLTEPQEAAVSMLVDELSATDYTVDDMKRECDTLDPEKVHEATQQALSRKLTKLKSMASGVFDRYGTDINDLVEPWQVTVIDVSLASQGIRRAVISYLSKELLQARINKENETSGKKLENPLLFVVEESHNFAGANLTHSCKHQLQRIASEGRKFGIGLVVISQKPSKIDEEILSQCNTGIYMHITNPKDKDHIKKSFEVISDEIVRGMDSLDIGEAIIAGALLDIPFILCKVDEIKIEKTKKNKFQFKKKEKIKTGGFTYQ
ncbi:MAG: ATP-binding protein, partial [Candidatus Altiarchaeota archaeon]|nr:ATP-binding protein [Candidatus Altiarchaeota archaeon]